MQASGGSFRKKLKTLLIITSGGSAAFVTICLYKGNEKFYKSLVLPALHYFEPESAHDLALTAAKWKLVPHCRVEETSMLKTTLWGLQFSNPIGLAAGFDKDGEAIEGMFKSGFGFIEVGSVTPLPQPGNPKPRIFRLREDLAVINRCGFNSKGHDFVKNQIKLQKKSGIIGINLGKNRLSDSAENDYVLGVKQLGPLADYLVINVSSPNTPGLRLLQQRNMLETLIDKVLEARDSLPGCHPLLVKIAPDLSMEEKKDIARVLLRKGKKIDGLIVSNTTISRPEILSSPEKDEIGGLSGKPLHSLSTEAISDMFQLTKGKIPIVGVGGVSSGKEAYEKVCAGASLIQIYTALIYEGPPVVGKIIRELEQLLKADGYSNIEEAVGADHRKSKR